MYLYQKKYRFDMCFFRRRRERKRLEVEQRSLAFQHDVMIQYIQELKMLSSEEGFMDPMERKSCMHTVVGVLERNYSSMPECQRALFEYFSMPGKRWTRPYLAYQYCNMLVKSSDPYMTYILGKSMYQSSNDLAIAVSMEKEKGLVLLKQAAELGCWEAKVYLEKLSL